MEAVYGRLYYKAGGRPWQLADVRPGVCYVGLVYKRTGPLVMQGRDMGTIHFR